MFESQKGEASKILHLCAAEKNWGVILAMPMVVTMSVKHYLASFSPEEVSSKRIMQIETDTNK